MNKSNLTDIRLTLARASASCTMLKRFLAEIADATMRQLAERLWLQLDMRISKAKDEIRAWRIGYPKGKHRIEDKQLEAIRQWYTAPHPKPKVRALARELEVSPTTVYAVLKELGWKKPKKG
jgi:DNA-binding GntR family transcriptional regulator